MPITLKRITKRKPCVRFDVVLSNGTTALFEFVPVDGVPQFTHRVLINGQALKMWLGYQFKPTARNMRYFVAKWIAENP